MTTTLTATRSREMPRINLLPPEIHERVRLRQVQVGLGGALVVVVAAIAGVYVMAANANTEAKSDLTASQKQGEQLLVEKARYDDIPPIYAEAEATQVKLATAMGSEVLFSQYLTDLSLLIPKNIWLTSYTVSLKATDGAATPAPVAGAPLDSVATMSLAGGGLKHNDVADWLDHLAANVRTGNPYFSNSSENVAPDGATKVVTFTSTADLTTAALSNRYKPKAGN